MILECKLIKRWPISLAVEGVVNKHLDTLDPFGGLIPSRPPKLGPRRNVPILLRTSLRHTLENLFHSSASLKKASRTRC